MQIHHVAGICIVNFILDRFPFIDIVNGCPVRSDLLP